MQGTNRSGEGGEAPAIGPRTELRLGGREMGGEEAPAIDPGSELRQGREKRRANIINVIEKTKITITKVFSL